MNPRPIDEALLAGGTARFDAILGTFQEAYQAHVPFREDRELAGELCAEARPVLEALAQAIESGPPHGQAHEAIALVSLLCRRAGLRGATPSAAQALLRALSTALAAAGLVLGEALELRVQMVGFEGYCGGRDERSTRANAEVLRQSQVMCMLAPRCAAAFLAANPESEQLALVLDEVGKLALHHDALACLVDVSRLTLTAEDTARALFDGLSTLASLGTSPLLYAPSGQLETYLDKFSAAVPSLQCFTDFGEALTAAFVESGYELKARRRWPRDLFSRGRSSGSRS
jgi:hypothetical protein